MAIIFTNLNKGLAKQVDELTEICFPDMPDDNRYVYEELLVMSDVFPEGAIVALDDKNNRVVGFGTGIFTDIDHRNMPAREHDILGDYGVKNHTMKGSFYFGSEFCVHPDFRGQGIGRKIYDHRKEVVVRNNKIGFFAPAALQGFGNYKDKMDIHEYLEKVQGGEIYDSTLTMQIRNNFQVVRPMQDFFDHPKADNWCALIYWGNPVLGLTDFDKL
ncbi:MAG: GNAT family N-acetyltransferase [Chloroflexota bacterium]